MKVKIFKCGLCKPDKRYAMTRFHLRNHLREEHGRTRELTNSDGEKKIKQKWWIEG